MKTLSTETKKSKFSGILSSIDLFGMPINMNFFGRDKYKSNFGGLCSVLFLCFITWAIYNSSTDLFSTETPKLVSSEVYSEDPREIILTKENFPFAVGVQAPQWMSSSTYISETIYTIDIYHRTILRITYANGTVGETYTDTPIATERCTPSHFGEMAGDFGILNMNQTYCIAKEQPAIQTLRIKEAYSSTSVSESIIVTMRQCTEGASPVTCADPNVIKEYLYFGQFNVMYVDMAVNSKNYSKPNTRFRNVYSSLISPSTYKQAKIELGHVNITTDSGWIAENITIKDYIKVNKITETSVSGSYSGNTLFNCVLQASKLEHHYYRSYKKIQDVLAEVGGLAAIALMSISILTTHYVKLKFRASLINNFFDVGRSEIVSPKKTKKAPKGRRVIVQGGGPGPKRKFDNFRTSEQDVKTTEINLNTYRETQPYEPADERNIDIKTRGEQNKENPTEIASKAKWKALNIAIPSSR